MIAITAIITAQSGKFSLGSSGLLKVITKFANIEKMNATKVIYHNNFIFINYSVGTKKWKIILKFIYAHQEGTKFFTNQSHNGLQKY